MRLRVNDFWRAKREGFADRRPLRIGRNLIVLAGDRIDALSAWSDEPAAVVDPEDNDLAPRRP
jgi:hypothetical protein